MPSRATWEKSASICVSSGAWRPLRGSSTKITIPCCPPSRLENEVKPGEVWHRAGNEIANTSNQEISFKLRVRVRRCPPTDDANEWGYQKNSEQKFSKRESPGELRAFHKKLMRGKPIKNYTNGEEIQQKRRKI